MGESSRASTRTWSVLVLLAFGLVGGCTDHDGISSVGEEAPSAGLFGPIRLEASRGDLGPGELVTVSISATPDGSDLVGGVEGRIEWEVRRFEFVGQIPEEGVPAIVGDREAASGAVRLLAVAPRGHSGPLAHLVFRAIRSGTLTGFSFDPALIVTPEGRKLDARVLRGVVVVPGNARIPEPDAAARMSVVEWVHLLAPEGMHRADPGRALRIPGEGSRFGDVNLDGIVNVLDVLFLANTSVGNEEIIIGTNSPSVDPVSAANVWPYNLPGLGGSTDPCPPGLEACGSVQRILNVLDVLAVARESVGIDEDVVGEAIPRGTAADTAFLAGSLNTARVLSPDSVYVLLSTLTVEGGGSLTAPAGTRILANSGAGLVVARDGTIDLHGSTLDPIILGCRAQSLDRGCWKGLIILGNAPVNRGSVGPSGCREIIDDPREGPFGGCDAQDDRGDLGYVRVEYATRGVELLGVGSGTRVDGLQVHGAKTGGVTIAGGSVDLKRILVTATGGNAFRWRDGWSGRAQHLLLQLDPAGGHSGILGQNGVGAPSATPISRPVIYNATVAGIALGSTSGAALELRDGSGVEIHNLLALTVPIGLDIDGSHACSRIPTDLVIRGSVFAGTDALGDPDADSGCPGSPQTESILITTPGSQNTVVTNTGQVADLLKGALNPFIPDFRPTPHGVAAGLLGDTPPSDGFFEVSATHVGGAEVATVATPNIPWYSGWTRGGVEMNASFGSVEGSLVYEEDGFPVVGALVYTEAGDLATMTRPTGGYTLELVRPGNATILVANLPSGCAVPPANVWVSAGVAAQVLPLEVACSGGPPNLPPTADPGGPYTATAGTPLNLSGAASSDGEGSVVRYDWDFGDGASAANAGPTPSHTYASPGTYTVTLTVHDEGGLTDVGQATVVVSFPAPSGNLIGRWVDATGIPIASASVGSTVFFQLCTSIADINAFQAQLAGFAALATNTESGDLVSSGSAVHPQCAGTVDILNSFFTVSGTTEPINAQIVSLSSTSGSGAQGIFRFGFTLSAPGTLLIDLVDGSTVAGTLSGPVPILSEDIQPLQIH